VFPVARSPVRRRKTLLVVFHSLQPDICFRLCIAQLRLQSLPRSACRRLPFPTSSGRAPLPALILLLLQILLRLVLPPVRPSCGPITRSPLLPPFPPSC